MTTIIEKIRGLISDLQDNTFQTFSYTTSSIFTIATPNATATSVLVNGVTLDSANWSYDTSDQELTISSTLTSGDAVQINFSYFKYSSTEIIGYVRGALVHLSINSYISSEDYEVEDDEIYPIPTNKDEDMIAFIASILIKPNYVSYRTPTIEVRYPKNVDKDEKIQKLIKLYRWGNGDIKTICFD